MGKLFSHTYAILCATYISKVCHNLAQILMNFIQISRLLRQASIYGILNEPNKKAT